ncbi:MAG: hypothetical protein HY044_01205 [Candidatus Woesebacteria bacterium]|nr:MAG: hypothetical protein HY044_01205 [Candidatus Woesebacteria bacterium]
MKNQTPLCELAYKYGTDKCPQLGHNYTPVYYQLLKDKKEKFKKILELGIGSKYTMQYVPKHYQTGASLLMWRDFFPNAQIYGVDRHPSTIFQTDRIKTILSSTSRIPNLQNLIKEIGSDIDLVIDDGPHNERFQLQAVCTLMPLLKKDVIYVIEDSNRPDCIKNELTEYNCEVFKFPDNRKRDILIIVRKKY